MYFGSSSRGINAEECLTWRDVNKDRDPQCQPIGGQSVWGLHPSQLSTLYSSSDELPPLSFLTASIDSTSLFYERTPGGNDALSSTVALLAAAQTLNSLENVSLPVGYGLFQGDEWGYMGSLRFVRDINDFECQYSVLNNTKCLNPIYPSTRFQGIKNVSHVFAFDQVGLQGDDLFWLNDSTPLPPSPLTPFVHFHPTNQEHHLLTRYPPSSPFLDKAYHTRWDTILYDNETIAGFDIEDIDEFSDLPWRVHPSAVTEAAQEMVNKILELYQIPLSSPSTDVNESFVATLLLCLDGQLSSSSSFSDIFIEEGEWCRGIKQEEIELISHTFGISEDGIRMDNDLGNRYTSIITASTGGLPIYQSSSSSSLKSNVPTSHPFNENSDRVFAIPSRFEAYLRNLLLSSSLPTSSNFPSCKENITCLSHSDCESSDYYCSSASSCCLVSSFYHTALDLRIHPEQTPNYFQVNSDDPSDILPSNPTSPLATLLLNSCPTFTEPFWASDLSLKVFSTEAGNGPIIAFLLGLVVLIGGGGILIKIRSEMEVKKIV